MVWAPDGGVFYVRGMVVLVLCGSGRWRSWMDHFTMLW